MIGRPGAMVPLKNLESGNASLQLPGIQLRESGVYRCEVVITPHKAVGQVKLEVVGEFPGGQSPVVPVVLRLGVELRLVQMEQGFRAWAYESDRHGFESWASKGSWTVLGNLLITQNLFLNKCNSIYQGGLLWGRLYEKCR